jgi:hypothetical protein
MLAAYNTGTATDQIAGATRLLRMTATSTLVVIGTAAFPSLHHRPRIGVLADRDDCWFLSRSAVPPMPRRLDAAGPRSVRGGRRAGAAHRPPHRRTRHQGQRRTAVSMGRLLLRRPGAGQASRPEFMLRATPSGTGPLPLDAAGDP